MLHTVYLASMSLPALRSPVVVQRPAYPLFLACVPYPVNSLPCTQRYKRGSGGCQPCRYALDEAVQISLDFLGPLNPVQLGLHGCYPHCPILTCSQVFVSADDGPILLTKYPTVRLDIGALLG